MRRKFKQQEVEKLIAGLREAYENKIRQLETRNEVLVSENRTLRASLAELKSRENKVGKAIVDAEAKGEEIKEFYRMSAETEWKTLRLFAEKWKKLAEQMEGVIPKGDAEKYAKFADDLAALLGKDKAAPILKESARETEPTEQEESFDPKEVIGKYIESEEETGFRLEDVLNPKGELDLAKLCRGLGLMKDEE